MKTMIEQANAYLEMYRNLIVSKINNERGASAVEWILIVLAVITLVAIVGAAVTTYVQNKTAELGS